ncbi:tetratricopeptide repeat protein [Kordia sp.]|uniref:tetratricopeptide repeat protein n=1 Tax=Kordia sp. TaxID=1965332 RepID=UPI003B59ACA8
MKYCYVVLLVFTFSSCGFTTEEEYYNRAMNHEEKLDYINAIVMLDKAIARNPDYKDALIFRGYCKSQIGKLREGTNDYQKALKLEPNNTLTLFNLAGNYNETKDYEKSIEYYNKALRSKYLKKCDATTEGKLLEIISPFGNSEETGYEVKICELQYWRGLSYYENKEYDAAIRDLKKSIKGNFDNYGAYYYLGDIYLKKEELQKACQNFSLAADLGNIEAAKKVAEICQNDEIKEKN